MTSSTPAPRGLAAATWGWLALGGVVTVVLGLVCVLAPGSTLTVLAVAFSLFLIGNGFLRLMLGLVLFRWAGWRRALQALLGVLLVVAGVVGLVDVMASLRLFTLLVGIAFVLAAAGDFAVAVSDRRTDALTGGGPPPGTVGRATRWSVLGSAVAHLLIGVVFLVVPELGLIALAIAVGTALVCLGAAQLVAAFYVRRLVKRALSGLSFRTRPPDPPDDGPRTIRGEVL